MKTQDPLCQLSDCHTGAFTQLCISRRTWIVVMNAIVIPASICFTQTQIFCHLPKRIHWICFLVGISHFSPKPCSFGEINALVGMNLDSPHWSAVTTPKEYPEFQDPSTPQNQSKNWHKNPSPHQVLCYLISTIENQRQRGICLINTSPLILLKNNHTKRKKEL